MPMKLNQALALFLPVALCLLPVATGCRKSDDNQAAKEAPVVGKPSDPAVPLKAEWRPGYRYVMQMDMNQSSQMQFGPRAVNQDTTMAQDYSITVTNVEDGNRGLELEIQSIAIDVVWGDQTVLRYDSLNKVTPSEGPGVELLDKLIGGRVRLLVTPDNDVLKVEGIKELLARVDQGGGQGNRAGGARGMMSGILQRIYNEDYFKQLIDLTGFPNNPVQIGESWPVKKEINSGMAGTMIIDVTNTLSGWQERGKYKCARIGFEGTLASQSSAGAPGPFGGAIQLEDGKISGSSWFAPEIGLPIESAINQSYNVTGTRPTMPGRRGTNAPAAGDGASEKFSFPTSQTISIKLADVVPLAPQP